MPNDTGTAFLVDPMGHAPQALSEREFEEISKLLTLRRASKELLPIEDAVGFLLHLSEKDPLMGRDKVLQWMVHNYIAAVDDEAGEGVLVKGFLEVEPALLSKSESETLQQTLTTIRLGGWLADWLALQMFSISNATCPDDRYPSPLKTMASLTLCAAEYEERMETTMEEVKRRPDLFQPPVGTIEAIEAVRAMVDRAESTKPPAKAPAARKPRKKSHVAT